MRTLKKGLLIVTVLTSFISSGSFALPIPGMGTPVIDVGAIHNLGLQLKALRDQYQLLKNAYDTANEQKKIMEDTQRMMEGHYNFGDKFSNPLLESWQHSGRSWDELMSAQSGVGQDPITSLAKAIEKEYPLPSADSIYSASKNKEQAHLFDLLAKTNLITRASNTLTYNSVDDELKMLDALQKEIEKSPNQKATLDLIARIQIEEAKLAAYQIKSQAANAQLTSLQTQQELTDAKWASDFFKWH